MKGGASWESESRGFSKCRASVSDVLCGQKRLSENKTYRDLYRLETARANNNGTSKQIMSGKGLLLCCCLRDYEAMCYATCRIGEITSDSQAQPDEMSEAITVAVSCRILVSYL